MKPNARLRPYCRRKSSVPELAHTILSALHTVRQAPKPLENTVLSPGIWIDIDPDMQLFGTWESPVERIVDISCELTQPGHWFGLHVDMPDLLDLTGLTYLGIIARSSAPRPLPIQVCLRSRHHDTPDAQVPSFHDCFFRHHMLSQPDQSDHSDILALDQQMDVPRTAAWRQLILFLPPHVPVQWSLHSLRLFAL